jgi:hydrogenase maturation protease
VKTSVLGLGNVLMGDDAFGPYVIQVLEARYSFPEDVTLLDAGTPGLDLVPYLSGVDALIVVDTVLSDDPPGTVKLYDREQLLKHAPQPRLSPHDPSLKEALLTSEFSGDGPREVLLLGVIPQATELGVGLSPPVKAALETAAEAVVAELKRLDHEVDPRPAPVQPEVWWERKPSAGGT